MATHLDLPIEPRQIGDNHLQTINARDLHERLGVRRDFSTWIKGRIAEYGFEEGADYCSPNLGSRENQALSGKFGNLIAGLNRRDYHLTLEMAKELALVENNDHGRAIRRSLIAMEKQMREELPALIGALQHELLLARPEWQQVVRYQSLGLSQSEIGKLVGMKPSTVRGKLRRLSQCRLVSYQPDPRMTELGRLGRAAQLSDGSES